MRFLSNRSLTPAAAHSPPRKKSVPQRRPARPSRPDLAQLRPRIINSFSDLRVHGLDGAIFQFVSKTRATPSNNGVCLLTNCGGLCVSTTANGKRPEDHGGSRGV